MTIAFVGGGKMARGQREEQRGEPGVSCVCLRTRMPANAMPSAAWPRLRGCDPGGQRGGLAMRNLESAEGRA